MAVKRYRPSSTSTSGTIYRIEKATTAAGYDPETAVYGYDACAFYSTNFVGLDYPAITGIPTNKISKISIVYRACSSTGGSQGGAIQLLNNSNSIAAITIGLNQYSDTNSYLHDSANCTTYDIPSSAWDLILNGSWSIRVLGRGSNTTFFTIICLDIEYEEPTDLRIGANKVTNAFLGSNLIKRIYKGAYLLYDSAGILPSAYQKIEYVYFNGTNSGSSSSPYIDTGIVPTASKGFYIDMDAIGASGCTGWGTGADQAATIFRGSSSGMKLQCDNVSQSRTVSVVGRHTWVIDYYQQKDGYDTTLSNISVSQYATINFYLGGWHEGNSVYYGLKGKVYNFKVYDSGNLIANYIPCYRKEDDVIGFYDLVSDTFKTNSGSGAFSKGPEVEYVLPSTYQEVEYIQSDGSQYIDTGISSTSAIAEWQIKLDPLGNYVHNYEQYLAGDRNAGVQGGKLYYAGGTIRYQGTPIGSGQELSLCDYDIGAVELAMMTRDGVTCDGTVKSTYPGGVWGSLTFWIFNSHSETGLGATMRLYYLKMYSDAVLVRNFIPCYRKSDNVIGLYDTVSKTFFTNSGSGSFTKGPNI